MNSFVDVAGWTLIHFLWQGAVLMLLTKAALGLARRRQAQVRYLIACAGLAASLALPAATAALLLPAGPTPSDFTAVGTVAHGAAPARTFASDAAAAIAARVDTLNASAGVAGRGMRADDIVRGVVFVWVLGVALLLGRMTAGWWQVRELHRLALETPACGWQQACARVSHRLGITRFAHVVESAVVEVPTVVGWLRPVIILPVAAIASLTPSQVEAILAHELAHIRRYDYVVNLCQTLAETLLFYHPGVWWISSRIRVEREHCCDEIAVAICGDPVAYAEALTELESWRTASTMMALAATGGSLLDRVRRILCLPAADEARSSSWVATLALTLLFTAGAGGVQRVPALMSIASARSASAPVAERLQSSHVGQTAKISATGDRAPVAPEEPAASPAASTMQSPPPPPASPAPQRPPTPPAPPTPPTPPASAPAPVPTAPPLPPAATSVTAAPAPPAPPAPASPPAPPGHHFSLSRDDGDWHARWTIDGQMTDVQAHGDVAFNDALTDVESMADGGYLKIRDWSAIVPHTVQITSSGGRISHAYFVGGMSRPWGDEAQRFLATEISRLVRQSGLGASARTKSILEKKGVAGVLDEIDLLEGNYARRLYFEALIGQHHFDAASVLPVLEKVSARMTSDFDRRQILTAIARAVTLDARSAAAYMRVVASMRSDFDRRQALSAVLAAKPLAPGVADLALETTADMTSDFDRRQVLHAALAGGASADRVGALLPALASMRSSFDKREVLVDLIRAGSLGAGARPDVLHAAEDVGSDFDKRIVLTAFVRQYGIDASTRDAYFTVVKTMRSDSDRTECLLLLARSATIDPSMRPAFVDAAQSLRSTYDQNRVLAALVRSERASK